MKKRVFKKVDLESEEIRPEYDFTRMAGGVRGKYYKAYRKGHTVEIHRDDGTKTVHHFKVEDGAVII